MEKVSVKYYQIEQCLKIFIHHEQVEFIPGIQSWYKILKSIPSHQQANIKIYMIISIDTENYLKKSILTHKKTIMN